MTRFGMVLIPIFFLGKMNLYNSCIIPNGFKLHRLLYHRTEMYCVSLGLFKLCSGQSEIVLVSLFTLSFQLQLPFNSLMAELPEKDILPPHLGD